MTESPKALVTARRNLAQRIERFLVDPDRATVESDAWEAEHVQKALACLEMDDHAAGEWAMLKVEKAEAFRPVNFSPTARPFTAAPYGRP